MARRQSPLSLYLPAAQLERLRALSRDTGVPVAALARRAIGQFLGEFDRTLDALKNDATFVERLSTPELVALAGRLGFADRPTEKKP